MKFKAVVPMIILALVTGMSAYAENGAKRQRNQMRRVRQGVKSGEMTRGETRRALRQQRRIRETRKEAASDGTVTRQERRKINRMQNRASKNIGVKKHNQKERGENWKSRREEMKQKMQERREERQNTAE
tara:strand:+ start:3483 stop:3872 length:390 start_codon:yes stop_codon:yes gene_type:complete